MHWRPTRLRLSGIRSATRRRTLRLEAPPTLVFHTARSTGKTTPINARRRRRRRKVNHRPLAPDDRPPGTDTRQRLRPLVRRGLRGLGPVPRRGRRRALIEKALRGPGVPRHGQAPARRVVRRSPTDAAGGVSRRLLSGRYGVGQTLSGRCVLHGGPDVLRPLCERGHVQRQSPVKWCRASSFIVSTDV